MATSRGLIDKLEGWLEHSGFIIHLEADAGGGIDVAFLDNDYNVAASVLLGAGDDFGLCLEEAAEEALEWLAEADAEDERRLEVEAGPEAPDLVEEGTITGPA